MIVKSQSSRPNQASLGVFAANTTSAAKPERKSKTARRPYQDLGQRATDQNSKAPSNIVRQISVATKSGLLKPLQGTRKVKTSVLTVSRIRRRSGKSVISARQNTSGPQGRWLYARPSAKTASSASLPGKVCAKETTAE